MKKILVPTDFSISADYGIHYALELAKIFDASIDLSHSLIPFESGFYSISESNKENLNTEKNLINRLAKIKSHILKSNSDLPISFYVDRGPESIQITKFCKKNKIDLIVMGTKGASGLKEAIVGSFTADVMTKAPCLVMAIPQKCKFKRPKRITYASDYDKKDIRIIQSIFNLNSFFNAQINILHIDDTNNDTESSKAFNKYKIKTENNFPDVPLSFQHIEGEDVAKEILHATFADKTDILVISPIKREGIWNHLFHKSITKTVSYHIHIPLLTIPFTKYHQIKNPI